MNADKIQIHSASYLRLSALIFGSLLFLAGCCTAVREPYYGPTSRMAEVVNVVNRNNEQINSLWANTDFSAEVVDNGTTHSIGGSGVLIFRRPGDLLLRGSHPIAGPIFELGSNQETYWMQLIPQVKTAWFGSYKNLGRPCVQPLPIQPDMLVEVLGVSTFNTNFLQSPVPVMTFNHELDAYEFTFSARLQDRWFATKRILYDRASQQPIHVAIFDENGRTVLSADLEKPVAVETANVSSEQWPKVASVYKLSFPETKTFLKLTLYDVAQTHGKVPNDRTFKMPAADGWSAEKVIQVDQKCDD
ncbi:hypothetical protein BH10PLA1_BH10PLA1_12610 [soil metagenome]